MTEEPTPEQAPDPPQEPPEPPPPRDPTKPQTHGIDYEDVQTADRPIERKNG